MPSCRTHPPFKTALPLLALVVFSSLAIAAAGQNAALDAFKGKKTPAKPAAKPSPKVASPKKSVNKPKTRTEPTMRRQPVAAKSLWEYLPNPDNLPAPVPPPTTARTKTNPIDGAEMVWIPAGTFIRGSKNDGTPGSDVEAGPIHKPQRLIYLDGYYIYKYPVTVAMFRKFCVAKSYAFDWEKMQPPWGWQDDHPMVNVTYKEAWDYCAWVGGVLPSEAQWEKAARGTDGRMFPWGQYFDDSKLWCPVYKLRKSTASVYRSANVSVSPFGCVDMAGNVWQWCADWFEGNYYTSSPPRNPVGPTNGTDRVRRGGSWNDGYGMQENYFFRTAYRYHLSPDLRGDNGGFRASVPGP